MASHGQQTIETPEPPDFAGAKFVEYEEFIESQLRKTRSHVRGVDIAAGLMVLLAGTLAWFFVAAMIDHWLITGGLGFWGRLILLVGFLAAAGWWTATQILPLLIKRINPLYAAYTIERSRPSLKNSLVNFLLFRSDPAGVHRKVFEAIEEQAATDLVGVSIDSAVDRTRLVRLGYLLVGIVAVCALYALVSPKNLFQTFGRVAMPWADISPPTRTTIDEVEPGSAQAFRGQQVTVKARVQGLPAEGKVILYYTTADRQIVDRPVEMSRPPEDYRHVAVLPAGDAALQQSLTYRIEAGDAQSADFAIDVVAAPTIVVRAVEYKYPEYTGLLGQRVELQGDLKAIEGTQVTLEALANQDIASAHVDFDCDDTLDLPLRGEGAAAKASFRMALSDDRQKPDHANYQLTFKNAAGQRNPQPVKHQIEVTRDVSPEVQFVAPNREEIELPLDAAVDLEIVAVDPDFALASVTLSAAKGKDTVVDAKLLDETWRGQFVKKYRFQPNKLKLAVGDTVEYFAVAVDNKSPRPNQTETSRRRIRIVSPSGRGQGEQLAQKEPSGGEPGQGDSQAGPERDGDHPRDAQPDAKNNSEQGQPGDEQSPENSGDPENSADGKQGQDQPEKGSPSQGEQQGSDSKGSESGSQQQGGEGQQAGDGDQGKEPAGEQQEGETGEGQSGSGKSGSKQTGADKSAGKQSGGENSGSGNASGEKSGSESAGSQSSGQQQAGKPGPGDSGDGQSSKEQASDGQSGGEQSVPSDGTNDGDAFERILKHREEQDKQNPSEQQDGQKENGAQSGDQKQSGDKNPPSGAQPAGKKRSPGEKQSGEQQSGSDQQGDQPAGSEKSGAQDKSGQQKSQPGDNSQQGSDSEQNEQPGDDSPSSDEKGKSESGGQQGQQSPGNKPSPGDQAQRGAGASDKKQPGEQQGGDKQPGEKADQPGENGNQPGEQKQPEAPAGAKQEKNTSEDGAPQKSDTQGQGAQAKDDPTQSGQQPKPSGEQRPDAKGGDGEQQKGQSGAGQKSNDNQGSPHAQDSNQPREKSQQPSQSQQQESSKESQEQSPSNSKRESDSESSESGDRSGGGKKGGGQKANQSGTGGAGQNTAADEGAGQSEQSGDGETSDRAGDDKEASGKTGQSASKQGSGTRQESGSGEQQQPGGEQSTAEEQGEPSTEASGASENSGGGAQGGDRPSGKPPGPGAAAEQAWKPGVDAADKANLDYSRKATDLALEHLRHELGKDQPDPALLDRLGWTREQAEAFVNRWEAMRKNAQSPEQRDATSRRQLDDALRSLGLRPRGATLGSNAKRDDRSQGYQESQRTTPPAEYSEAFKAYTQGTSRGGK